MPRGTSPLAQPDLSQRQGKVVIDDKQVGQRDLPAPAGFARRQSAPVHECPRLDQRRLRAPKLANAVSGVTRPGSDGNARGAGDAVQNHKADIVPVALVPALRISKTDDGFQIGNRKSKSAGRKSKNADRKAQSADRKSQSAGRRSKVEGRRLQIGFRLSNPRSVKSRSHRGQESSGFVVPALAG